MITYRKAYLKVAEVFFDEKCGHRSYNSHSLDLIRHFYRSSPVPGARSTQIYTLWINLLEDPESLLAKMSRATRVQLRHAANEGLKYEYCSAPSDAWTHEFFSFFDLFADSMRLKRVNRQRLLALRRRGALDLSRVSCSEGRVLVWHANILSGKFAFCLYSSSLFRDKETKEAALIGRANRLLHWRDILRFRDHGVATYDFGGWYPGKENGALLQVNRFKESFGGELVVQYNCDQALTRRGAVALWVRAATQRTPDIFEGQMSLESGTETC